MSERQPEKDSPAQLLRQVKNQLHKFGKQAVSETQEAAATINRNVREMIKEAGPNWSKIERQAKNISQKVADYWQSRNRKQKQIIWGFVAVAVVVAISVAGYQQHQASMKAYEVYLEGSFIGIVREEAEFEEAKEVLKQEMKRSHDLEAYIPENHEWVEVKAQDEQLSSREVLISGIRSQLGQKVQAVAIHVEGEPLVTLRTEAEARDLLGKIQEPYLTEGIEYTEVDFLEDVEIVEIVAQIAEIRPLEDALHFVRTGTDEEKVYTVEPGDSSWFIAERNDMTVEEIAEANLDVNLELLSIGEELNLIVPKPYLTVKSRYYVEQTEEIPFETENVETESMYEGDQRITVQGEKGKRDIKAYLVEENGVLTEREILKENIHAEPVTRVVAVGVKKRPTTMATGTFINPTRGRLTSPFGMRSGRRHTGIDIANATGTPITASDAGRVSFAGSRGAYGRLVIIDHENGYQTYYAHMNTISVSSGERVYKDQQIGTVGSTGRSTGPHLHFEVRKNGTPVNPRNYVSI